MVFRLNHSSGVPLYVQLMEQIKHALVTGALRPGDQLPTIRRMATDLVMNPNTVARAYRELEHEGVMELRHGSGAYVSQAAASTPKVTPKMQAIAQSAIERLTAAGLTPDEVRRLIESELSATLNPEKEIA